MSNFGSPSRLSQATWPQRRQTQDEVTAWGSSSVDQAIKKLTTGHDVHGLVVSADSYGTATAAKNTVGLHYNGWRQLKEETQDHDGGTARAIVYGYETGAANSNTIRRTSVTYPSGQTSAPVQNYAYTGPHANELSRVSSIRDGSTDIISYQYLGLSNPVDVNYNVPATHLSFGTAADHYDGLDRFGRPITVQWLKGSTASVKAQYRYDALFRRVTKTVGTTTRRFYYSDQWQILEEYVGTATNPEARYWYGLRDINDIARRQRYSSGTTLLDDLYALRETMNVVALVNSSGTVIQRMAYDAFGNARLLTAAWATATDALNWSLLFHAHYQDSETGLYQMRFRYYNPNLGVWLSRDPLGEEGGVNLYEIAGNQVIIDRDILGLNSDRKAKKASKECINAGGVLTGSECCCGGVKFDPSASYCCGKDVRQRKPLATVGKFCKIKMKGAQFAPLGLVSHCYLDLPTVGPVGFWPQAANAGYGPGHAEYGDINTQWKDKHGNPVKPRCCDIKPDLKSAARCNCNEACMNAQMKLPGNYGILGPGENCCERARTAMNKCGCKC